MINIKPLPDDLQKIAIEELGEDPKRMPEDLLTLKTWIKQQPHLRARMDDQFLTQFLRGCKYSLEKAKQKIDLYFSLKTKYPEMFGFTDVDDPKFRRWQKMGCYTFLPKPLNENGPRIFFMQYNFSADEYNIEDLYYATVPIIELAMLTDPYACVHGLIYIYDLSKINLSHILQLTPNVLKKIVSFLEKSVPLIIRKKLREKIVIIGNNFEEVTKHIPLKYLPKDMGGENGLCSEINAEYMEKIELYRQYFKENVHYGTDESLRAGKQLDLDEINTVVIAEDRPILMANIKPLPEDLQKIAIEELNEVPSRIPDDLEALKTWIKQQPHLRARTGDQFLIQFLRGCKYSLERAKEKIDLYFTLKSKYPDMFSFTDVDDPKFIEYFNIGTFTLLPKPLNETGPRIMIMQINYTSQKHTLEKVYYASSPMFELSILNDPYAGIQGIVYLIDMRKSTLTHIMQATPNLCKKAVWYMEKSIPLRIRGIYFVCPPVFAAQFFKLILPMLSEKIRQRVHILPTIKDLTQHIPLEYLPKCMGGGNGDCLEHTKEYFKKLQEYREFFKENESFGTDEKLRPGKPLDLDGLLGVGGSFRKLTVD
ncbi:uncharacterized protein LOC142239610 [Haematobia irritans]|uniref:uncharacterized protein LOC142239610 n=1 Tax=Haematobia irritans TaxID=7368 RepID=UPI003F4F7EC6